MEYKLKELVNISSSKRIYYSEYTNYGVPFYRGKEIIEKSENKDISNELFISKERYEELRLKYGVPRNGDIIITAVGTLGKCWLVDSTEFYFKDGNCIWFSNFDKKINNKYLYYYIKSSFFQNIIDNICIGSTQKALTIQQLKEVIIDLPCIEMQNKIVKILSDIYKKIELNNQINNNLLEIINCLYKNTFSNIEVYDKAENIANITIGKTPPRSERECFTTNENDMKWVSISDLGKSRTYIFNTSERLTLDSVDRYNVKVVPKNTIILSFKLTVGRIAITTENMATNEAIAHLSLKDDNMRYFLYSYLKNFNYAKLGNTSSIATAVNSKIIKEMPIGIPDKETLKIYNEKVQVMFEKLLENEKENQVLEQLRDTLLPKLMNGEIDLENIEF